MESLLRLNTEFKIEKLNLMISLAILKFGTTISDVTRVHIVFTFTNYKKYKKNTKLLVIEIKWF